MLQVTRRRPSSATSCWPNELDFFPATLTGTPPSGPRLEPHPETWRWHKLALWPRGVLSRWPGSHFELPVLARSEDFQTVDFLRTMVSLAMHAGRRHSSRIMMMKSGLIVSNCQVQSGLVRQSSGGGQRGQPIAAPPKSRRLPVVSVRAASGPPAAAADKLAATHRLQFSCGSQRVLVVWPRFRPFGELAADAGRAAAAAAELVWVVSSIGGGSGAVNWCSSPKPSVCSSVTGERSPHGCVCLRGRPTAEAASSGTDCDDGAFSRANWRLLLQAGGRTGPPVRHSQAAAARKLGRLSVPPPARCCAENDSPERTASLLCWLR